MQGRRHSASRWIDGAHHQSAWRYDRGTEISIPGCVHRGAPLSLLPNSRRRNRRRSYPCRVSRGRLMRLRRVRFATSTHLVSASKSSEGSTGNALQMENTVNRRGLSRATPVALALSLLATVGFLQIGRAHV